MDLVDRERGYGMSKAENDPRTMEEILSQIVSKHPIELEERLGSLDRPLIIECACPGWQPRMWPPARAYTRVPVNYVEGGVRYPAIPCSIEDQANDIVQAVKAGCQIAHIHARDPEDCLASHEVGRLAEVYDHIFKQTDVLNIQHTWHKNPNGTIDYVVMTKAMLEAGGGNRYCQGAVVLWPTGDSYAPGYTEAVQAGVAFMQENHIVPVHKIRGSYHARKLHRDLVDTGVLTGEPFVLVHDMGHPYGWTMDDTPWWPIDMIASLEQTRDRFPDNSIIGVYSGGRNWLLITMLAVMLGVDLVRVGIEDVYWMYPHRDEVIQRNIDCVNKIIDCCKLIGRPIATLEQARQILGMKRTS